MHYSKTPISSNEATKISNLRQIALLSLQDIIVLTQNDANYHVYLI
jgi:hypothetical protein